MATTINNASRQGGAPPIVENSGAGFFLGVVLFIVTAILFFVYVVPRINSNTGGTRINVPDKIDINVQQPK